MGVLKKELSVLDTIKEKFEEEELLIANGFDDAVIGIEESSMRLIYSVAKCMKILILDMSEEEALDHFCYNVSGGYVGEKTPIWCYDYFE